jgi:cyclophilin family peptidyl-prolyl cis-trans isomerase
MPLPPLHRLACAVLLLLVAACGSAPAPPARSRAASPPRAVPPAADRELEARAVLLLLADRRLYDETALQAFLGEAKPVREALAVALGRIGDPRGRSLLQGLLVDAEAEVCRAAAFALGQLGAKEATRALIVAAVDDDAEVGALAVEALGRLGTPLADVRRALGALETGEAWRRLAPSLFRFKEPATVAAAEEALAPVPSGGVAPAEIRRGAVFALSREPRPEGAATLRRLLADADPVIRARAARGVGIVGALDDLARLLPLVDDVERSPRIQALRAGAALLGRTEALPPLVWGEKLAAVVRANALATAAAQPDNDAATAAAALEAAGRFLPNAELEEALREAWAAGEPRARELALAALVGGRLADRAALLAEAAASSDRRLRARAAEGAAKTADLALLERLRRDPEPLVRVAALGALAELDEGASVRAALDDPDPTVRATALEALAGESALATKRIAALIDAARADGATNDVRTTGVRVLLTRAKSRPAERAAVVEILGRLAGDADWLVRREAAKALVELGEAAPALGPVDTGRDLAAYRQVVLQTLAPVQVATERGAFTLELACPEAPTACLSFLQLVRRGYFDGTSWHRVVPDFVAQGGDPRGDGWGGPGYTLRDEINRLRFGRGAVGVALSGPDTGGSQFFVTLSPQPHLDGGYTAFGRVVAGLEVVDTLRQGDRVVRIAEARGPARGGLQPGAAGALRPGALGALRPGAVGALR